MMRTLVKGKNYDVPARVRSYAERKLGRLERYLDDRSDATVELSVERRRNDADSHIVDVTLVIDGQTLRGTAAAASHTAGIDEVVDKIERRAVSFREKPRSRARSMAAAGDGRGASGAPAESMPAATAEDAPGQVVKVKRFAIEPMFEEDAVARMEELGHAFFLFVNAETERVAVLYRRRSGDYGLIEPVIGGAYTFGGADGRGGAAGRGADRR